MFLNPCIYCWMVGKDVWEIDSLRMVMINLFLICLCWLNNLIIICLVWIKQSDWLEQGFIFSTRRLGPWTVDKLKKNTHKRKRAWNRTFFKNSCILLATVKTRATLENLELVCTRAADVLWNIGHWGPWTCIVYPYADVEFEIITLLSCIQLYHIIMRL